MNDSLPKLFISYAREDDKAFVERLDKSLIDEGYDVLWDKSSMPSRGPTFLQEIRDAINVRDRVLLVMGPKAKDSPYVRVEWEYALSICLPVTVILRLGDYDLIPEEIGKVH